jgi:hypothetical protein
MPMGQNEIGYELEGGQDPNSPNAQAPPSQDRAEGGFTKFFKDPKNIATALIFGAALTQPRPSNGADGLSTFMQRAAGAAAFRGALESGGYRRQLDRQQTAFQQAQADRRTAVEERQAGVQERGAAAEEGRLAAVEEQIGQNQSQFEGRMAFDEREAQKDRALRLQLEKIQQAPNEKDWMAMVPSLANTFMGSMEFEEGLTPQEKIQMATNEAMKTVMMSRALMLSGGQMVVQNGHLFIDDGKGNLKDAGIAGGGGGSKPPPASASPTPGVPAPSAAPQARDPTFAQPLGEKVSGFFARGQGQQAAADLAGNAFLNSSAQRLKAAFAGQGKLLEGDIHQFMNYGDDELQSFFTPEEIAQIRQLQQKVRK